MGLKTFGDISLMNTTLPSNGNDHMRGSLISKTDRSTFNKKPGKNNDDDGSCREKYCSIF
jgi:hypothetical protein